MTRPKKRPQAVSPELGALLAVQTSLVARMGRDEDNSQIARDLADCAAKISTVRDREQKRAEAVSDSIPRAEAVAAFKAMAAVVKAYVPADRQDAAVEAIMALVSRQAKRAKVAA